MHSGTLHRRMTPQRGGPVTERNAGLSASDWSTGHAVLVQLFVSLLATTRFFYINYRRTHNNLKHRGDAERQSSP